MPCVVAWGQVVPSGTDSHLEVVSRPLRLRTGLDPARLRELDDDLEIAEFLRKSARLDAYKG